MDKARWWGLLMLIAAATALGEEILLKDGTKVVGRMASIKDNKIQVQTPYGKMQVSRGDIQSITFPENQTSASSSEGRSVTPVDEALDGNNYVNRTEKFALTVPIEWKVQPELRKTGAIAGLSSPSEMQFVIVAEEEVSASLEGYKGLVDLQLRADLANYEAVSDSAVTIDARPAALLNYRGLAGQAKNFPVHYLTGIVGYEGRFVRITAWCAEPLFKESQRVLENIIFSYHELPEPTVSSTKSP